MIGEYKLAKTVEVITDKGRRGTPSFFARVCVEVTPSSRGGVVINAISQSVIRSEGEVNAETHSDWVGAAMEGAKDTLRHLERLADPNSYTVKITKVIGLEVDTTEDAVRTAAALATWRAINPDSSEPKPVYDGHWYVAFPKAGRS